MIQFMIIGAGKYDDPPYSKDGTWRTGLLLDLKRKAIIPGAKGLQAGKILYKGKIFYCPIEQMRKI
jgi:hypothetical protein